MSAKVLNGCEREYMESTNLNSSHKKNNLRYLRRYLGLTQKEFIERFLSEPDGTAKMSIATYSNLESRGGVRLNDVVLMVADQLSVNSMIFSMESTEFAEKIDMLLPSQERTRQIQENGMRKGNINQLLYRLTMYFADQIFDHKLKKGDQIESDRVLAVKLGVGRSAIREALKVLDVLGMIDIRPGQGTYISNDETNFFIIPLSWSLFLNGKQVENILTVRNLLEVKAAELAAECTDAEALENLKAVDAKMNRAYAEQDYKAFLETDLEFHQGIARCSRNTVILSMMQTISSLMKHVSGSGMVNAQQLKESEEEHSQIYDCILQHDGKGAAEAMQYHLERAAGRYNYR